ncbi:MAG TPA: amidohydrolase [Candidatus Binatia bacterium]|nr:amidohydrolase [Candidatus Binatia bacterium]
MTPARRPPPARPVRRGRDEAGELLFHNGRLVDARRAARLPAPGHARPLPRGGGEAVWVRGGRIEAVGTYGALRRRAGRSARGIDLRGGTLTPGFTDAHIHLITWRRALDEPWLEAQTPEAVERAVAARLAEAGAQEWILVRGWVPREWPAERRRRAMLDRLAPGRPLVLQAVDGHSVWANGEALTRAGIDGSTPDPSGGRIERDASGGLTGILVEAADRPVRSAVVHGEDPAVTLGRALARARALGITSAHDFDRSATWRAAQDLERKGSLGFRLLLSIPLIALDQALALGLRSGFGTERLRIGPVKMFADGTLGSATALLEAPYEGSTDAGIEVTDAGALAEGCRRAAEGGLSVAIHAIGDRAVRHALDAIETPLNAGLSYPLPPRIEHVQLLRFEDLSRFRSSGTLASVQPIHQVTDRTVARAKWGERTGRSYAYRALLGAGAPLLFGSDAPFDRAGPLLAIQAALSRREAGEADAMSYHPEQRLRLTQALRAHLESSHLAAGWATPLGRIEAGYGADLVRFDQDLWSVPTDSWHQARVTGVWVGGRPEPIEKM